MSNIMTKTKKEEPNFEQIILSQEYEFSTGKTDKIQFKGLNYSHVIDNPELFYGYDFKNISKEDKASAGTFIMEYIKKNIRELHELLPEVCSLQKSDFEILNIKDTNKILMGLATFLLVSLT